MSKTSRNSATATKGIASPALKALAGAALELFPRGGSRLPVAALEPLIAAIAEVADTAATQMAERLADRVAAGIANSQVADQLADKIAEKFAARFTDEKFIELLATTFAAKFGDAFGGMVAEVRVQPGSPRGKK